MTTLPQQFREFWLARSIPASAGASEAELATFERQRGVILPADVRGFFELMDGTNGSSSPDDLTFWSLSQVQPIPEVMTGFHNSCIDLRVPASLPAFESYYVFADYMIWSHFYAINLAPNSAHTVVFVCGTEWFCVATSFSDFLRIYMQESRSPHFCAWLPEVV